MIKNILSFKNASILGISASSFSGFNEYFFKSKTTFYCKNTPYNQKLLHDKNIQELR